MSALSNSLLTDLQRKLVFQFSDVAILKLALTHRSASKIHNQRLEFLGDAALGLAMADLLFQLYPDAPEGELSQLRASLVNRTTLAAIARRLDLGAMLTLGLGEQKSGGRHRDSILSDALEAVLGAIYIDGGILACRQTIKHIFADQLTRHTNSTSLDAKDPKTRLQEIMQAKAIDLPDYEVMDIKGDEHDQEFFVRCRIALMASEFRGSGRSRREAEQQAALAALHALSTKELI
ncbi:MAG: ribonuclease III [Pseudohongiella sp.]|nr:ribonuclease III [Pseudohongiella sp.]MDO9519619.1 ribonuclease III [Pseudohongiella sp.]MDP2127686.1 ribonuclease III [Pseudohongiella sp.]